MESLVETAKMAQTITLLYQILNPLLRFNSPKHDLEHNTVILRDPQDLLLKLLLLHAVTSACLSSSIMGVYCVAIAATIPKSLRHLACQFVSD